MSSRTTILDRIGALVINMQSLMDEYRTLVDSMREASLELAIFKVLYRSRTPQAFLDLNVCLEQQTSTLNHVKVLTRKLTSIVIKKTLVNQEISLLIMATRPPSPKELEATSLRLKKLWMPVDLLKTWQSCHSVPTLGSIAESIDTWTLSPPTDHALRKRITTGDVLIPESPIGPGTSEPEKKRMRSRSPLEITSGLMAMNPSDLESIPPSDTEL